MYSGHGNESALHTHGVDFMLSEEAKAMVGWETNKSKNDKSWLLWRDH